MVEELQRIMGDDFPIAVSVSSSAPIDEAAVAALQAALTRLLDNDIYRTGNPDLELVSEFYEQFDIGSLRFWEYADDCPYIVGMGVRVDGYLWLTIAEENWDVIYGTVAELRQIMGEDFPIAVSLQNYRPLSQANRTAGSESATGETTATSSDVFGGHTCVIQRYLSSSQQTLAFAAASAGQAGMVLSGHWLDQVMPVNAWVYSPTSWYPLPTNRIGIIDRVGGVYSDSSYMRPAWPGGDRVRAGVQHYGSHMPVWGSEDPELGSYVYKTGQTTGTTLAYVYGVGWAQAPWHPDKLHEQYFAIGHAAEGDSGAPVYWVKVIDYPIPNGWWPPDPEFAILKGVLWAGSEVDFIFSTISQVIDDLDVWPLPGAFW